ISLHFNAFTSSDPNGVSTHYYDVNDDHELAKHVQDALHQQTNLKDRGVRQDDYHVLRKNRDTSILVELGFITNPSDVQAIQINKNASAVATAIADGLNNTLIKDDVRLLLVRIKASRSFPVYINRHYHSY